MTEKSKKILKKYASSLSKVANPPRGLVFGRYAEEPIKQDSGFDNNAWDKWFKEGGKIPALSGKPGVNGERPKQPGKQEAPRYSGKPDTLEDLVRNDRWSKLRFPQDEQIPPSWRGVWDRQFPSNNRPTDKAPFIQAPYRPRFNEKQPSVEDLQAPYRPWQAPSGGIDTLENRDLGIGPKPRYNPRSIQLDNQDRFFPRDQRRWVDNRTTNRF